MRLKNPFRRLTPAEVVARQLADAQLDRLEAFQKLEEHTAYCRMLEERVARLTGELEICAAEGRAA